MPMSSRTRSLDRDKRRTRRGACRGRPRPCPFAALALIALAAPALPARADEPGEDVWSIRCISYTGQNRIKLADNCAEHLRNVRGLKAKLVQVFHERDESIVFYGRYQRRFNDRTSQTTFTPDPDGDLALIRSLSREVQRGGGREMVWPFRLATMDTLPAPSSVPPEWDLETADGVYSLQVAVFYDTQEMRKRRFAAEQYCRLLRERGEKAYVHHGQVHSIVTIGAFPREALRTFEQPDPLTGRVQVIRRIVDPQMLEAQKRHPHHLQNGAKTYEVVHDPKTHERRREPHVSFAVEIPKPDPFRGLGP